MSGTAGSKTRVVMVDGQPIETLPETTPQIGILGKLGGRKFLMAIAGVIALALHTKFGIDTETVLAIGGIVATFILGQSYSEAKTGGATSTTTPITDPTQVSRIDQATEIIRQDTATMQANASIVEAAVAKQGPDALRDPRIAEIVENMK